MVVWDFSAINIINSSINFVRKLDHQISSIPSAEKGPVNRLKHPTTRYCAWQLEALVEGRYLQKTKHPQRGSKCGKPIFLSTDIRYACFFSNMSFCLTVMCFRKCNRLYFWKIVVFFQEEFNILYHGRNPKQPPGMYKTLQINGISTTNLNWLAGFLNHQQYVIYIQYIQFQVPGICADPSRQMNWINRRTYLCD